VTETMKRTQGTKQRVAGAMLAMLSMAGLFTVVSPAPAEAWLTSSTVTLQGRAICASSKATWVWVEGSNGERGWATKSGGNYSFTFRKVPVSNTLKVRVNYGGTHKCTELIGLNRPKVGSTQTRDLIRVLPNG